MPNRTAKFASTIFAAFLAGTSFTTMSYGAPPAAEDCLSAPNDQAHQGGHWYYHIDRATKRHCWYLGEARGKLSQAAAPASSASAKPAAPKTEPAMQRSIADAHAELTARSPIEQPKHDDALAPAIPADDAVRTPDTKTQRSVIASRWPDQSEANSSATPGPATANDGATVSSSSDAAPPPDIATIPLAAADSEKSESQSGSIRMLSIVIIGALALAGLLASAIVRFGGRRRNGPREVRGDRRAIWDSVGTDRLSPSVFPNSGQRTRVDIPHELASADDPDDRVTEMLARLARMAKT